MQRLLARTKCIDFGVNMLVLPQWHSPLVNLLRVSAATFLLSMLEGGHDPEPAAHMIMVLDVQHLVRAIPVLCVPFLVFTVFMLCCLGLGSFVTPGCSFIVQSSTPPQLSWCLLRFTIACLFNPLDPL